MLEDYPKCKCCGAPILMPSAPPPVRRSATAYYNFSRLIFIALSPLCERCKRNPDIVISVIETYCDLKLLDVQKDVIVKWVMENNKKQLEKRIKPGQKLLGYRFEYIP